MELMENLCETTELRRHKDTFSDPFPSSEGGGSAPQSDLPGNPDTSDDKDEEELCNDQHLRACSLFSDC